MLLDSIQYLLFATRFSGLNYHVFQRCSDGTPRATRSPRWLAYSLAVSAASAVCFCFVLRLGSELYLTTKFSTVGAVLLTGALHILVFVLTGLSALFYLLYFNRDLADIFTVLNTVHSRFFPVRPTNILTYNRLIVVVNYATFLATEIVTIFLKRQPDGYLNVATRYLPFSVVNLIVETFIIQFETYLSLIRFLYSEMNSALLARTSAAAGDVRQWRLVDGLLKEAAQRTNDLHQVTCLLFFIYCFMETVYDVHFMVHTFDMFRFSPRYCYDVVEVVGIVLFGRITKQEAERTAHCLHQLFIDNDDPIVREEVELFSLQLLHRKVDFNACGFFKLDFSLLYSMVGAVTTYIVILMQFQGAQDAASAGCGLPSGNCSCPAPPQ